MTDKEFYELESLLGKLRTYLQHRYAIIPGYIHDGYNIGIYDVKTGLIKDQSTAYSLQKAADNIVEKLI